MADVRSKKTNLNKELKNFINANSQNSYPQTMQLQQVWENIASEKELINTDNITRSSDKKNIILIYVVNSHWAAELSTKKELYRIMFEKELKEEIKEVKFLVNRKAALKKSFKIKKEQQQAQQKKEKSISLNNEEEAYTQKMLEKIKNNELKEKLYKAVKADFEWKKGRSSLNLLQNPPESP